MASNVIDYFATLGRKSLTCKSFESLWVNDKLRSPSEIWSEAITDIAIVHQGEQLPDATWQLIDHSIDNRPVSSRSTIAVRRRGASNRLDHITKIKLIKKGDVIPLGFELIDRSITKMFSAEIENVGALAIKRVHASETMFIQGQPLVDDICVVLMNEGEEVPEGYVSLERIPAVKESNRTAKPSQTSSRIILAYHQRPAMGLCDLSYESATLDRYPQKDQHEFPLPVVELPMFAFPHDLRLSYSSTIRFPLPVFFSFVFTNSKGMHRYAACLRFYEIVPKEEIEAVFYEVYGSSQEFVLPPNTAVFCPKIICVVSRMPFYRAMRRYLCQIFSMSLSSLPCPLEFFIASVVGQVPLPVAGGRPFHVVQDAALISSTSCAMNAIEFEVPLPRFFPPMDLDFAAPLRCLSVDRLLAVFALMLRESKMVFLCCSNTLLTETMETLRSLLFPLKWSSCFVSRLPDALSGLLEAPGGFMIGLHMFEDRDNDVEVAESHVNKHFGNRKAVRQTKWTHSLTAGTFIVDLSSNALFQYDGKSVQTPLGASALTNLVHSLPPGPRKRLQKKLQHIATSYCIGPQTVGLDRFDSAFDFQAYEDMQEPALVTALSWESFPTLEIRDCFMNFMADLLGNYQKYIIPPLEDMSADTYRTFKEEFSVEEYLNDAGPTVRSILELVVETQMFAVLLQQRSEASDYSLVFFESAGELMREYKLQAGGHNFKDVSATFSASNSIPDMVAPLYKLLAAKAWAAANGKYYHISDGDRDQMYDNSESPKSSREISGQSTPPEIKPEEKKYFSSLRTQSTTKRTMVSSPPYARKEISKPVKVLTPLDCLLIALEEMEAEAIKTPFNEGVAATPRKRGKVGSRNELDRRVNLRLHDRSLGPLIIPGPSKSLLNTTLPHAISTCRRHLNHDLLSPDRVDDTNSVVTCSTDVSDDDSVSLPIYSKAIAEFGVSSPLNNGEANYLMAMVALRSELNCTTLQTEESNEIEYESDVERDSEGRFTYQIGWPVLHSKLLKLARRSVHTRLSGLRKSRVFALQMINRNIQLFLRAPTDQSACYRSISCSSERNSNDLDSSTTVVTVKSSSPISAASQNHLRAMLSGSGSSSSLVAESQTVMSTVLEVLSVSLLLLCTRTLHEAKPLCDMLQVLGILAQADSMGVLPKIDETIWRTLLVACASTGGDVMRKVACVVFDTLTACGITPDALTYGSYTRALAATKYAHEISPCGHQIDQFLYLEEIGLAWFQQRSAVIEQSQADISVVETRSNVPKGGGMLSTMFTRKKRTSFPASRRRVSTRLSGGLETTGASDAAVNIAAQLGLVRPAAAYALLCPQGVFLSAAPRYMASFERSDALDDLSQELSGRMSKLMLDYKSNLPPVWMNNRGASTSNKKAATIQKLDLSLFAEKKTFDNNPSPRAGHDPNTNGESLKDLFGPGASTASTDSFELKKTVREEAESRSGAYMASAMEASSVAASTVKHYGNILIGGMPASKRTTTAVPVDVLQSIVRSQAPAPPSLLDAVSKQETPSPPQVSPINPSMSRMTRLTQSVFSNPFQTKEKEKPKELVENVVSLVPVQSTAIVALQPDALITKADHSSISNQYSEAPLVEDDSDRRGSSISVRFSDDEADDSDDDLLSRRSSSASIRIKDGSSKSDSNIGNGASVRRSSLGDAAKPGSAKAVSISQLPTRPVSTNGEHKVTRVPSPESDKIKKKKDAANTSPGDANPKRNGTEGHEPSTPVDQNPEGSLPHVRRNSNTSSPPTPDPTVPLAPVPVGPKRLNVLAMQTDVMASMTSAFLREGSAVGIHSATPCPTCTHTLLDEEVMAVWAGESLKYQGGPPGVALNGIEEPSIQEKAPDTPPLSNLSDIRGSDIEAAHCINCPVCTTKYSPKLHISCYKLNPTSTSIRAADPFISSSPRLTSTADWTQSPSPSPSTMFSPGSAVPTSPDPSPLVPPSGGTRRSSKIDVLECEKELKVLWRESVAYLSPKGLRLALEEQMERIGERVADPCWLHVHRPAVYWNILWFSSRLKVPTGFLASPPPATPRTPCEAGHSDSNHTAESDGPLGPLPGCGTDQRQGIGGGASPPSMWHLPTLIGWKEIIVKIKVHRYLTKSASELLSRSASLSSFTIESAIAQGEALQLADLFPGCEDLPPEILFNMSNESAFAKLINMKSTESSSSLSPAINRSVSTPLLMTLMRTKSLTTPAKLGTESPASPDLKISPLPVGSSTPLSITKTPSPIRIPSTRLDRASEYLDGTAEGMRRAILEIGKYQWLMNEIKNAASLYSEKTVNGQSSFDSDSKCDTDSSSKNTETKINITTVGSRSDESENGNSNGNSNGDSNGNSNGNDSGSTLLKETLPTVVLSDEIYSKQRTESRKESHLACREIYIDLLTLYYLQRSKKIPDSFRADSRKSDQFKESAFEKLYTSVVRELLSPSDFELLGTTEAEMINCTAGRSAQAFRIGMGFLF